MDKKLVKLFLLLQNHYYQVVSNVMVVGDGRKYLTCLITLKVVNMIKLVKKLLWTMVDVSIKNIIGDCRPRDSGSNKTA